MHLGVFLCVIRHQSYFYRHSVCYITVLTNHQGHEEATFEMGPWLFTLDYYHTIQAYAMNRSFRKEFHLAHVISLSNGDFDNTPVIKSILDLRWKKAKLLGYNNYAEVHFSFCNKIFIKNNIEV